MNNYEPFFMEHKWLIWTIAVVTGMCHAKQAAMADYYRQFHLFFLKALLVHHIHGSDVINIGINVVAESERDVIENGKMREKGITLENRIDRTFMRG